MKIKLWISTLLILAAAASGEQRDPILDFPVRDSLWIGCWGVRWDGAVMGTAVHSDAWVGSGWNFINPDNKQPRYPKWWWRIDGTLYTEPYWLVVACFENQDDAVKYGKKLWTYAEPKKRHGKTHKEN